MAPSTPKHTTSPAHRPTAARATDPLNESTSGATWSTVSRGYGIATGSHPAGGDKEPDPSTQRRDGQNRPTGPRRLDDPDPDANPWRRDGGQ